MPAFACLCLPLPASACLRVAFGLPPACSWPATGLLLNCFLGSLKPQASKCEATKSKRKDKGAAVHAAGVFDPPGRSRPHTACQTLAGLRCNRSPCSPETRFIESPRSIYRSLRADQHLDLCTHRFSSGSAVIGGPKVL